MAIFSKAKAMIGACEPIMFIRAETEGATSVRATIMRNNSIAFASKYYQGLTQELHSDGMIIDCARFSHWVPVCCQDFECRLVDHNC